MRVRNAFLSFLSLVGCTTAASAQVNVTAPGSGATASYRQAVIRWDPILGATSYRLEIDDDPNFGSPEIDVVVNGTSYALNGTRLRLNGQLSWAAHVRINGQRWNAGSYTPSYFPKGYFPALAVDSTNRVFLGYQADIRQPPVKLVASNDWSAQRLLSTPGVIAIHGLNLAVDEDDIVHAHWTESPGGGWIRKYANSGTGWTRVALPPTGTSTTDVGASLIARGGRVDIFQDRFGSAIEWLNSTDGGATFVTTTVPNSTGAFSARAARDAAGIFHVVADLGGSGMLQDSASGWSRRLAPFFRWPALAVSSSGEEHVIRWLGGQNPSYSSSTRSFATWVPLPMTAGEPYQDVLPLVLDEREGTTRLYTGIHTSDGVGICASGDSGTNWQCVKAGTGSVGYPEIAVAPDGTVHAAWWQSGVGVAYANSLGSFLAKNFAPELTASAPAVAASSVTIATRLRDVDGDEISGTVRVGRFEQVESQVATGQRIDVLNDRFQLHNSGFGLWEPDFQLVFRGPDIFFSSFVQRPPPSKLPITIEAFAEGVSVGTFTIEAWDDAGARIRRSSLVGYVVQSYTGTLPVTLNIAAAPLGECVIRTTASDGANVSRVEQTFSRTAPQATLLLTNLGDTGGAVGDVVSSLDSDALKNGNQATALKNKLAAATALVQQALDSSDAARRTSLLTDALTKLRQDILPKTDGCVTSGAPDQNDWVTSCSEQGPLHDAVGRLIAYVEALML